MADCERMMQLCEESLDRTLTPEEQALLDAHLQECPACAAYLADLRFLTDTLHEAPPLPIGLHERIMSSIENETTHHTVIQPHPRNRKLPVSAMLVAAAACVVLALSGGLGSLMNNGFQIGMGGGDSGSSASGSAADTEAVDDTEAGAPADELDKAADTAPAVDAAPPTEDASAAVTSNSAGDAGTAAPSGSGQGAAVPEPASTGGAEAPSSPGAANPTEANAAGYETTSDGGTPEPYTNSTAPQSSAKVQGAEVGIQPFIASSTAPDNGNGEAPAVQSRMSRAAVQPQVGAFISDVMGGEVFAGCYLVEGGSNLPEIGQEQQRDASFAYYAVDNNLSQLESLLDALEKAGCTVTRYEESGVLFNDSAKRVIFVVRLA